ncbi:unnamed protein product [[Candida] boidinii]|nr:unnamed protein product [[Candida] boidinii]
MFEVDDIDEFEFFFLCARFRFKLLVEILNVILLGCENDELLILDTTEFLPIGLFISFNLKGTLFVEFKVELEFELFEEEEEEELEIVRLLLSSLFSEPVVAVDAEEEEDDDVAEVIIGDDVIFLFEVDDDL